MAGFDVRIGALARRMPAARRLMTIPREDGDGAGGGDASQFRNGREMAAWLGLVPRQHTTGGRPRLLQQARRPVPATLLIHGARSALQRTPRHPDRRSRWAMAVEGRRGRNVAAVALANKNARAAWAVLRRARDYDAEHVVETPAGRAS